MQKDKSKRKFLWIYAVVLFSSAFTVLLLTAFSQLKLSSNIEEYKKKLKENENSIKGFNLSLNSAAEEKRELQKRIEELEKENTGLKSLAAGSSRPDLVNQREERSRQSFDSLLKAETYYKNNQNLSSAKALSNVKEEDLGETAKKKYTYLKSKVYVYAAKDNYRKAKEQLTKNNFEKAKNYFEESLAYDETAYYEENTLFYLALVSSKFNETDKVKQYADRLKAKYPKSEYIEKVEKLNKE